MANVSAFGFGGYDPFMSTVENGINSAFSRRAARYNAKLQYRYAELYAKNGPSWHKQGLLSAGYNPMLAISGATASPTVAPVNNSFPVSSSAGGFDNSAFQSQKLARKTEQLTADKLEAERDIVRAEASSARSQAALDKEYADMELEALKDDDYKIEVDGKDTNPTRSEYRQMIRNDIQRRRYTNSREHAIAEDTINAIHGGSSAYQAFEGARLFRRRK